MKNLSKIGFVKILHYEWTLNRPASRIREIDSGNRYSEDIKFKDENLTLLVVKNTVIVDSNHSLHSFGHVYLIFSQSKVTDL